ncbi:gamma-aminobutyraldehyde dehydrogenase [Burkholderia aenigmatica]|uniref:Gamma-aminobutyraldehyde dehydrogenase n=1 Tax=Burkholderia aenigmatica TaxID=2015348 RepID=A0A6P2IA78_9BURK|nr:hypothetical protein [Burkholderia aenigmatica]VWB26421.1 gamma-aminobutyraldehyde dehydrogenase [Burkholderia aenigmatica]
MKGALNSHFNLISEMPHGGMKILGYGKDISMQSLEDDSCVRHVTIANQIAPRVAKRFDAHLWNRTECG